MLTRDQLLPDGYTMDTFDDTVKSNRKVEASFKKGLFSCNENDFSETNILTITNKSDYENVISNDDLVVQYWCYSCNKIIFNQAYPVNLHDDTYYMDKIPVSLFSNYDVISNIPFLACEECYLEFTKNKDDTFTDDDRMDIIEQEEEEQEEEEENNNQSYSNNDHSTSIKGWSTVNAVALINACFDYCISNNLLLFPFINDFKDFSQLRIIWTTDFTPTETDCLKKLRTLHRLWVCL